MKRKRPTIKEIRQRAMEEGARLERITINEQLKQQNSYQQQFAKVDILKSLHDLAQANKEIAAANAKLAYSLMKAIEGR